MTVHELATEITKTAIENDKIRIDRNVATTETEIENRNAFNAKQIADFYKTIFKAIYSASE